jgi:hypothetical protein
MVFGDYRPVFISELDSLGGWEIDATLALPGF